MILVEKFLYFLVALSLVLSGLLLKAQADDEVPVVQAVWERQSASFPSRQGRLCVAIRNAVDSVTDAIEARRVSFSCRVYGGADVSFESLTPVGEGHDGPAVRAQWRSTGFNFYGQGRDCVDLADGIDVLLDRVHVRNVHSTVFCDQYGGSISYQFEALVPIE